MSKFHFLSMSEGDEQIPQHQPWSPPESDEELDEDRPPRTIERERTYPRVHGGKRPRSLWVPTIADDETPDLAEYFEDWNMSAKQQIICCRAYASYLAAKKDAKKK